jgi:hypothetical protein
MSRERSFVGFALVVVCVVGPVFAAVVPQEESRFDARVIWDPSTGLGRVGETPDQLPGFEDGRAAWRAFQRSTGGDWRVWLDRRSGVPLLVEGRGIEWIPPGAPEPASAGDLEETARRFLADNEIAFRIREGELVFSESGSGRTGPSGWILLFHRDVAGLPVEGQSLRLYVRHGRLVALGADRWGEVGSVPTPVYAADGARAALHEYMGIRDDDAVLEPEPARLILLAVPPDGADSRDGPFEGAVGAGIEYRPAWRLTAEVAGERGSWVGKVDAVTGEILAFYDDHRYSQVKGGVYPASNDQQCPLGCEQPNFPMPYADVDIDGVDLVANDMGVFECSPMGGTATTNLIGPYVRINDNCGAVSETTVCDEDLDLGVSAGDNCTVPAGSSAGNTHSARVCFYHLNRIMEKGRYWLPGQSWPGQRLTSNVNINSTCNAYWNGTVNFYRSGGGCGNTGEIAGVVNHEYGHGLDQNDGGGYDNPSEAYADVVAIIQERDSCVGRGFYESGTCSGYGDTCLTCTGIRDMDWDDRESHTPATPTNFNQDRCGGGGGACGKEVHCESYVPSEAIYDLAVRDLPAMGYDLATSWQIVDRLWYGSRQGSGGDVYNCSLPNSDSCGAGTWFTQMRVADDDDGDLSNGTPHAAAIFAAFDRHDIACGSASDASNQNSSSCPVLDTPVLTGTAGSASASLSWTADAAAAQYRVARNDVGCDNFTFNIVDTIAAPTTDYTDVDLANDFPVFYRVHSLGANPSCASAVSNCVEVMPQPFAGTIKLDRTAYGCSTTITISVRDANTGSTTVEATIFSDTESDPETVVLTETSPGSARFTGTIQTTSGAPSAGDGLLSLAHGDTVIAQYVDADDGEGGFNLLRETSAAADCVGPVIGQVADSDVSDVAATITWVTDEASTSVVDWGEAVPPDQQSSTPGYATSHSVRLTGLRQCTVYHYSVTSVDYPGNSDSEDNGGAYFHFETLGDFGGGLQPCHAGKVTLPEQFVSCSASLPIELVDIDLNRDSLVAETVTVSVTSSTETVPETALLTETGPNTSTFTGSIVTAPGAVVTGDGILQSAGGDLLTATYRDDDDGTGAAATSFDSALADCAGPGHTSVWVSDITDDSATVNWTTTEPTTGVVDWGTTADLGNQVSSDTLRTMHSVTIGVFPECGRVFFRVASTDAYGNVSVVDAEGAPFELNAATIPGGLFRDGFESLTGWALQGEWEIGEPQGLGSSPGDPTVAFFGTNVLGHDLSGQGDEPGNYERGSEEHATSPAIDASALANAELKFRRWLNVGGSGIAYVQVTDTGGVWNTIWTSPSASGITDSAWVEQTLDVSPQADGNADFRVRFLQKSGFQNSSDAGWNVDRVILRDASYPDFGACGGCDGAPTFAGLISAADDDPCADSGITLTWSRAPAWGTGSGGSYAVYRDTQPDFVPGPASLLASGLSGTSWTDGTAPDGATVYYVVRAENDETCGGGPANGGVSDGNLVRVAATDATSQPWPGDVGATLLVDNVNDAHARLTWTGTADAADFHVYRATAPDTGFGLAGQTAEPWYEDRDVFEDSRSWYYLVRAADACGNEGP